MPYLQTSKILFNHSYYKTISIFDNGKTSPNVVFLHGLGANAAFGEFITEVYPGHRIFIPEFSGHGESKADKSAIDIYNIAMELRNLFDHFNIHQPIICGHSLGAQVALIFDLVHPGFAKELVLISPAGFEEFADYQKQIIQSGLSMGSFMQQFLIPTVSSKNIQTKFKVPDSDVIASYTASMIDRPVKGLLAQMKTPCTIYFGENDPLIPNRLFTMEQTIPYIQNTIKGHANFKLVSVAHAGHWPMLENRKELVRLMKLAK